MQTIYFCLERAAPVLRYSSSTPRIGDTVALPELSGDFGTLKVFDVVWEFADNPHVKVHVHQSQIDPDKRQVSRRLKIFTPPQFVLALLSRFKHRG
jgi:hypothetical protein